MWCESRPSSPIRIVCPCTDATWPNDVCHRYLKFKSVWPCSMCILQHARFQTTPRRSPLYSCMHGFQTSRSLIQIFEFNFTLIMTSPILLHPHSSLLFIIVPLTFSRACMHTLPIGIIHRTHAIFFFRSVSHEGTHPHTSPSPSYRAFFISHACMCNDQCSSMHVCI